MKLTFLLPIVISFSTLIISCQKKSDSSTPTPDYRQNVVGTFYNMETTININTTQIISALSTFTTIPSALSINTTVSFGNINNEFKIALDPNDGTKADFTDTNKVAPTVLFYADGFSENSPITTFYIPPQSISNTLLNSITTLAGFSGILSSNPISIQGISNFNTNGVAYDGGYNSGNKLITAYAKGQLNISIGPISTSLDFFTLTITGTKQ